MGYGIGRRRTARSLEVLGVNVVSCCVYDTLDVHIITVDGEQDTIDVRPTARKQAAKVDH
jgi:hypothetical protein